MRNDMRLERLERRMLLAIYAPDVSFGQGGHADAGGSSLIEVLSDGSILVANVQTIPNPDDFGGYEAYAHRLNPDGTIDTTFGNAGKVLIPKGPSYEQISPDFVELPDGKLLVATSQIEGDSYDDPRVTRIWRLNANGSRDNSFAGSTDIVVQDEARYGWNVDAQGRLWVTTDKSLYRYSTTGVLDAAPFDGSVSIPYGGNLQFDSSGRLLASSLTVTRFDFGDEVALGRDKAVYVRGSDVDDVVTISSATNDRIEVSLNGDITSFDAGDVEALGVLVGEGANAVTVNLDLPTSVTAGNGSDTITTGNGADSITAAGGDNVLNIGDGNDTVTAGSYLTPDAMNIVTGSNGNKTVTNNTGQLTLNLGVGDSTIKAMHATINIAGGSNSLDLLSCVVRIGGDGANHIAASGSPIDIVTGDGPDRFDIDASGVIRSGGGDDDLNLLFYTGSLVAFAGAGNDRISWNQPFDLAAGSGSAAYGEDGNDFIEGGAGNDSLYGGAGKDTIFGGVGSDLISGGGGHDRLIGDSGKDRIYGGDGYDTINGGTGGDRLEGGDDRDKIIGNAGDDTINGGTGGDWLFGNSGNDQLNGDGGNDRLYGDDDAGGLDTLHGGAGNDDLVSRDDADDQLFGDRGHDSAYADDGDSRASIEENLPAIAPQPARFHNFALTGRDEVQLPLEDNFQSAIVAASDSGSYIFVATEGHLDGNQVPTTVVAVRYSADGEQIGDKLTIATPEPSTLNGISVDMDPEGNAIIVYGVTTEAFSTDTRIFARLLSKDGVLGEPILLQQDNVGGYGGASVSMDARGGFFIAWAKKWSDADGTANVTARAFNADATPKADAFVVGTDDGASGYDSYDFNDVKIESRANGSGAVVTYAESGAGGPLRIRFARVNTTSRLGELGGIVPQEQGLPGQPSLAIYPDNSFVIGYAELSNAYAQRFDSEGFARGDRMLLATASSDGGGSGSVQIAGLPDGGFVFCDSFWNADGNRTVGRAQRFDRDGHPDAPNPTIVVSYKDDMVQGIRIAADANGNTIVMYIHYFWASGGNSTVLYRRYSSDLALVDRAKLYVFGTATNDAFDVSLKSGNLVVTRNGVPRTFAADGVTGIVRVGFGATDTFVNHTALPVTDNN